MNKMNPEVKEKWLEALRSGEYKQGRTMLKQGQSPDNLKYCCIGVLCELAAKDGVIDNSVKSSFDPIYSFNEKECLIPDEVARWAGLKTLRTTSGSTLYQLNDFGKSFSDISDVIEEDF